MGDNRYPEDTPRTNEVLKASEALPFGSIVVIPEDHPPSCPWELARTLEREVAKLKKLEKVRDLMLDTLKKKLEESECPL